MKYVCTIALWLAGLALPSYASDGSTVPESQQTILLVPYGTWSLCQNGAMTNSPFCMDTPVYIKGQEPDLLLITAERADTVAFAYTITGTDIFNQPKTYSGVFLRNDNLPLVIASYTVINAGALKNTVISVRELSATMTRQEGVASGL